jgi:hypothetical protein
MRKSLLVIAGRRVQGRSPSNGTLTSQNRRLPSFEGVEANQSRPYPPVRAVYFTNDAEPLTWRAGERLIAVGRQGR